MKMADLLGMDFSLVGVFNRLRLSFGTGDATVHEVCRNAGIDTETFLLICRVYAEEGYRPTQEALNAARLQDIVHYLRLSHCYYTDVLLPAMATALENMLASCDSRWQATIRSFFADYKEELAKHFDYEESTVFPYVEDLLTHKHRQEFSIAEYQENHSNVEEKLLDLKNLIIKYMPPEGNQEAACQALFYLFTLETDLRKHTLIEEQILVPVAGRMEELSAREKEILIAVAQGKLNKEIADQYNISIHTVITHRKNITRKTGIKTVAGLTVYALLNNLIDMNTVE